ncbi:hypothetical protein Tco_0904458 [Tanacetum coccineum]
MKRESSLLYKNEQSSFMIPLQLKEDFLLNKELLQTEHTSQKEHILGIKYDLSEHVETRNNSDLKVKLLKKYKHILDKVSSPDRDYLVIYKANGNFRAFNYLMEGDLKIMMESATEENDQSDFWSNQQDWKIITWRLYEACGVCILEIEDGIVIHILMKNDVVNGIEKGLSVG